MLSRAELINFLLQQDIYLNLSDYEGTSLTMLEAMACGCVPIVTNVSGVDAFINNLENGFISDIGDIENIANSILYLNINRTLLNEYGIKCAVIVSCRCDLTDYINYIEKLINI